MLSAMHRALSTPDVLIEISRYVGCSSHGQPRNHEEALDQSWQRRQPLSHFCLVNRLFYSCAIRELYREIAVTPSHLRILSTLCNNHWLANMVKILYISHDSDEVVQAVLKVCTAIHTFDWVKKGVYFPDLYCPSQSLLSIRICFDSLGCDCTAIGRSFARLGRINYLEVTGYARPEYLLGAVQAKGESLLSVVYSGYAHGAEERDVWKQIFEKLPNLENLDIRDCRVLPYDYLPKSLARFSVEYGYTRPDIMDLVRRLEDPAFLPNVKSGPLVSFANRLDRYRIIMFGPPIQPFGLPKAEEYSEVVERAILGLRRKGGWTDNGGTIACLRETVTTVREWEEKRRANS